jgi:hypothetical protein
VVAGQEVYYLSHSVHFTQRCLYILTWTPPQPAAHTSALSPPLTLEQLLADLRLWLHMLAQHVPNAKLLLVGTRDDGSAEYQSTRAQVEAAVDALLTRPTVSGEKYMKMISALSSESISQFTW